MATRRGWSSAFYWVGVCMTVACVGLVLAGNTKIGFRLEHLDYPLSWIAAGIGVLAFLASEICRPTVPTNRNHDSETSSKYRGAFEI
jgi:hypothetical protein